MSLLRTRTIGESIAYGKEQGRDYRGRPTYRLWKLDGVVIAPKSSEVQNTNAPATGWVDMDRLTLHLPDKAVSGVDQFTWFPMPTEEGLALFGDSSHIDVSKIADFGEAYRVASAKAYIWKSPFTGDVFGTQVDIISQKVTEA